MGVVGDWAFGIAERGKWDSMYLTHRFQVRAFCLLFFVFPFWHYLIGGGHDNSPRNDVDFCSGKNQNYAKLVSLETSR